MEQKKVEIKEALNLIRPWLNSRVCQLFLIIENGKVKPEGSAFLIKLKYLNLLVTAGHVIAEGRHNNLCVPKIGSEGWIQFEGTWYVSGKLNNIGQDIDDYAYLILDEEQFSLFTNNGYNYIGIENIDLNHLPNEKYIYTGLGFRWRKTKRIGKNHHTIVDIISNLGSKSYQYIKQYNNSIHVLFRNNRKMFNFKNKNIEMTGRLEGMSGGPLWHTDSNHNFNATNPSIKLVGILHSYDSDKICATNINRLFQILKERSQIKT